MKKNEESWKVIAEIPADETPASAESGVLSGTNLLPADDLDPKFWDTAIAGTTRRKLFCQQWGLDDTLSRGQMITAILSDPAKIRANTVELKLWACTRKELDQKFESDVIEVKKLLATAGLEFSIEALNELIKQLEAKGEPQLEFQTRSYDPEGTGIPQLGRSKIGLLIAMIDFVATWPSMRAAHQAL